MKLISSWSKHRNLYGLFLQVKQTNGKFEIKIMTRYNTFLALFIISIVAMAFFLTFYIKAILGLVATVDELNGQKPNVMLILNILFNPHVIVTGIILALSSLAYRVLGIVYVAKNKTVSDGEKALWIIGFILVGFITGIVFLAIAKGKKFVEWKNDFFRQGFSLILYW